jgi:uncharacterized protein (DUF342 family)
MSVDVFGRNLKQSEGASRGPPGNGYKFTQDGQYDVDEKRLCNVADPQSARDAVNLRTMLHTVEMEMQRMTSAISELRNDLNNYNEVLNFQRTIHEENKRLIENEIKTWNAKLDRQHREIRIIMKNLKIKEPIHSGDIYE